MSKDLNDINNICEMIIIILRVISISLIKCYAIFSIVHFYLILSINSANFVSVEYKSVAEFLSKH